MFKWYFRYMGRKYKDEFKTFKNVSNFLLENFKLEAIYIIFLLDRATLNGILNRPEKCTSGEML